MDISGAVNVEKLGTNAIEKYWSIYAGGLIRPMLAQFKEHWLSEVIRGLLTYLALLGALDK